MLTKFGNDSFLERSQKNRKINSIISSYTFDFFTKSDCIDFNKLEPNIVGAYIRMLINLRLIPRDALTKDLFNRVLKINTTSQIIYNFLHNDPTSILQRSSPDNSGDIYSIIEHINKYIDANQVENTEFEYSYYELKKYIAAFRKTKNAQNNLIQKDDRVKAKILIFIILGYLASKSLDPWEYEYHLGISGIYKLFDSFAKSRIPNRQRIFIVAELPEELQSYRHHVARLLNKTLPVKSKVTAFTGDIGLHVGLTKTTLLKKSSPHINGAEGIKRFSPRIRCTYCNYNNETVLDDRNYHDPDAIKETALKRFDSALIYLCTHHDHHPRIDKDGELVDFLSSPSLRVI